MVKTFASVSRQITSDATALVFQDIHTAKFGPFSHTLV